MPLNLSIKSVPEPVAERLVRPLAASAKLAALPRAVDIVREARDVRSKR